MVDYSKHERIIKQRLEGYLTNLEDSSYRYRGLDQVIERFKILFPKTYRVDETFSRRLYNYLQTILGKKAEAQATLEELPKMKDEKDIETGKKRLPYIFKVVTYTHSLDVLYEYFPELKEFIEKESQLSQSKQSTSNQKT